MTSTKEFNSVEWFKSLDITWKRILKQEIDINRAPTADDLEMIMNLEQLDCSKSYIISLEPIAKLKKIKRLDFSNTKIKKLNKLKDCILLEEINASNTLIDDVTDLQNLKNLKKLNISNTQVESIEPLAALSIGELQYHNTPAYYNQVKPQNELDEFFNDAARIIVLSQQASTSLIQRKLLIGYNRAGRIMDQLEITRVVGPFLGTKPREVLIKSEKDLEAFMETLEIDNVDYNSVAEQVQTTKSKVEQVKKSFWKRLFG